MPFDHQTLAEELGKARSKGAPLRGLTLPHLAEAAHQVVADKLVDVPAEIEELLKRAIARFGGGPYGDAAACLFGLATGLRGTGPAERQEAAGDALGMSASTFRTRHQKPLVYDVADQVLGLLADQSMRDAYALLELRHPAESRLAVQWVERFEAYNRMWTPIYALGADLTAYRSTLLETNRPYDREPGTDPPDDPGCTQEDQAEGYGRFALYRYASFAWELRQFMSRFGGLWLLSGGEAELAVSEAVYQISWHISPFNERDESWLRAAIQDTRGQEMNGFLHYLSRTDEGRSRQAEWQEWLKTCRCSWVELSDSETEYFPTRRFNDGIADDCQVHRVVEACAVYCDTIDHEWRCIADWYHLDEPVGRGRSPEALYREWNTTDPP